MVWVMIDKCRKVATNPDKNDVPIELAARHIFGHIFQMSTLIVRENRNGVEDDREVEVKGCNRLVFYL